MLSDISTYFTTASIHTNSKALLEDVFYISKCRLVANYNSSGVSRILYYKCAWKISLYLSFHSTSSSLSMLKNKEGNIKRMKTTFEMNLSMRIRI